MKCGPDNCPITAFSDLTPAEQRVERGRTSKKMYDQGFTMEKIAKQLGVATATTARDLEGFSQSEKTSRPKGGRPKGSKKAPRGGPQPTRRKNPVEAEQEAAKLVLDGGLSYEQAATETGVGSVQVIKTAVAREEGRREPQVNRSDLSLSAQERFDVAVRQHKKRLDLEFEQRVIDGVKRRVDEIVLPHWRQQVGKAQELFNRRKALMDKDTFNTIRRGLHPDSRNSISDKKLGEAFDRFMALEKYLLNEKDSPTSWPDLPSDLASWDAMKRRATADRKAGKTGVRVR